MSGSATRTDLTTAGKFPTFFRVVPNDSVQSPSIVNFSVKTLKAKHVVVVDSQDDYSTALAKGVTYRFRLKGVKVDRESVAATDTDFSSLVTNVANDVQVVVFATQTASAAQTMSQQLREQGKKAVVLGTDGAYSPGAFKPKLGYVSSFAPDLRLVKGGRSSAVQHVLEEQDVRDLRPAELHGHVGRCCRRSTRRARTAAATRADVTAQSSARTCRRSSAVTIRFRQRVTWPARSSTSSRSRTASTRSQASDDTLRRAARAIAGRLAVRVSRLDWDKLVQIIVNGLTLGSVYALVALGFSMVYGILKLLNFAHGDVLMVGAFIGWGDARTARRLARPTVAVWS